MPLPDQTPKLPKLPFLVADAALLAAAWMISDQAQHPLSSDALLAVVACVGGAGILGAIPFLTDYARKQDEALDERQRGLEALARTVATSAEQIGIAAQGMHEIAELAQRNLSAAEALTRKAPAAAPPPRDPRGEKTAERLEAAAEKIAQAAADLAKAESALQKRLAAAARERERPKPPEPAPVEPPPLPEEKPVPAAPEREAEAEAPAPIPAEPTAPEPPPAPALEPAGEPAPVPAPGPAAEAPPAETSPRRPPRAPRKPKPEPEAAQEELAPEFSQLAPDETAPVVAVSADGATRLLVTAYIGIGNRLFIRGEGPGLNWEAGVPLQFVSIGKWRWETAEASAPVSFKLYKNDQVECEALGERKIEPGGQLEVSAAF